MTSPTCPTHRTPLVTNGCACRACDGAGTIQDGFEFWERYCDACRGSGLEYWCPCCEDEDATDVESASLCAQVGAGDTIAEQTVTSAPVAVAGEFGREMEGLG